jgi:hypothetical protein
MMIWLNFQTSLHVGILALEGEPQSPKKSQENTVFISYASEDVSQIYQLVPEHAFCYSPVCQPREYSHEFHSLIYLS